MQPYWRNGIPLGVVYFIKKARDGLNASPQYYRTDDTPEKRTARQKEYIKQFGNCRQCFQMSVLRRML